MAVSLSPLFTFLFCFSFLFCLMEPLRVASLNVNGLRDRRKQALLLECLKLKNIGVTFLQETHSDKNNEVEWGLWWEGKYILSHGSNVSSGVAICFSPSCNFSILSEHEIEPGRLLAVKAKVNTHNVIFLNIYANNKGAERSVLFKKIAEFLNTLKQKDIVIMGGDFNCTLDFNMDRNNEETHNQSSAVLENIIKKFELNDIWRTENPSLKQYTWVKVSEETIHAARLDRFYISNNSRNRVCNANIIPNIISDHKMITIDCVLSKQHKVGSYWHFNKKLLQDVVFCANFRLFWQTWQMEKNYFRDIIQWWEVGKTQVKVFCQQYTCYSSKIMENTIKELENEILEIENEMLERHENQLKNVIYEKKVHLENILHGKVKGALIRARFSHIKDIDGPTSFFFNLERKVCQEKQMLCLRNDSGDFFYDPSEMSNFVVDFYSKLYDMELTDLDSKTELFDLIPKLTPEHKEDLDCILSFQEVTKAVQELSIGKSPGLDGLPSEFFKQFWGIIGKDYYEVILCSMKTGLLPTSCRRAILSLLPKKGDITLLKNWRPVALLTTDYKIFSKSISNRLNAYMGVLIHPDQSYCIKNRCIRDNLFLIRDVIDYSMSNNIDVGILSLDQEKAFDRVDHSYLFDVLSEYGFGNVFISWIRLLYEKAECMVKVPGGLSMPIQVRRGIRQGCPLSGQLYSLVIEPLLCKIRISLKGLHIDGSLNKSMKLSAYADDLTVIIKDKEDIQRVLSCIQCYEKASSAKINWGKSEALWCGTTSSIPVLPGNVEWSRDGFKFLGVFLGSDLYKTKNWDGIIEKMCVRLSNWKWILPRLSYRGRVLIVNNLIASSLWHKMAVVDPPVNLVKDIQRQLVNFFWSGQHWLRAAVLYLPVCEGGQGLIDIESRVAAFRLQAAQRLLHKRHISWTDVACGLLRKGGRMGLDRHLFLMDLDGVDLTGLTPFYKTMLRVWKVFSNSREQGPVNGFWGKEEPIIHNPVLSVKSLNSVSVRNALVRAGLTKVSCFLDKDGWLAPENIALKIDVKSLRFSERLLTEIVTAVPSDFKCALKKEVSEQNDDDNVKDFPELEVKVGIVSWQEEEGKLLTFSTPELKSFREVGKKSMYHVCVKVMRFQELKQVRESKWQEIFGTDLSPKRSWRTLYKIPTDKRTGDLQWRIVHGIVTTNKHKAHLDSSATDMCPFCSEIESIFHLFLECNRLEPLFQMLKEWCDMLGHVFSQESFIYGPKYRYKTRNVDVFLNYLYGQAKLSIWLTRKAKIVGKGSTNIVLTYKGLMSARLTIEFAYYELVGNLVTFEEVWCLNGILCKISDGCLEKTL